MQPSVAIPASGFPSWSLGRMHQETGNVSSAAWQQCSPAQLEVGTETSWDLLLQQLHAEQSRLLQVERDNKELRNELSQLQQQHSLLEPNYAKRQKVVKAHSSQLAEDLGYYKPVLNLSDSHGQLQGQLLQLPATVGLSRPLQQQQQLEQAVPAVHAEAASAGAALQPQAATVGRKRARPCSATGSASDAAVAGHVISAASGGSSRQQLSGAGEPVDEDADEMEPHGCGNFRSSHSPDISEQLQSAAGVEQAATAAPDQMDAADEEESSQEELEAAECLQALATSVPGVYGPEGYGMLQLPSNPLCYQGYSNTIAAAAWDVNGSRECMLANYHSTAATDGNSIDPMTMAIWQGYCQGAFGYQGYSSTGAAAAWDVNSSQEYLPANYQYTAATDGNPIDPMMMAIWQGYQGGFGSHAEGYEFNIPEVAEQAVMPDQPETATAPSYAQPPQQMLQPHHHEQQHVVPAGGPGSREGDSLAQGRAEEGGAAGAAAPKPAAEEGNFWRQIKTETEEPARQACIRDWATKQRVEVECGELRGTYFCDVNATPEFRRHKIELEDGTVVSPGKFEEEANMLKSRNWQQSVYPVGYTMRGPGSPPMRMGHFLRIVGVKT